MRLVLLSLNMFALDDVTSYLDVETPLPGFEYRAGFLLYSLSNRQAVLHFYVYPQSKKPFVPPAKFKKKKKAVISIILVHRIVAKLKEFLCSSLIHTLCHVYSVFYVLL